MAQLETLMRRNFVDYASYAIGGDVQARIFCRSLEADLIAIAGLYRVSDDIPRHVWRRPIQAYLDDDTLRLDALT